MFAAVDSGDDALPEIDRVGTHENTSLVVGPPSHAIQYLTRVRTALIDVFVAGQLREHGVSLQTVRHVYSRLQGELNTRHPFCRNELLSDGKIVFMRGMDNKGQEELKEVLTRQQVFPSIILPFLRRIDYGQVTKQAERWHIAEQVVIDPSICFGKPIVEAISIPTAILASAYRANDEDEELVGEWYNIHPKYVLAAVAFEDNMAA